MHSRVLRSECNVLNKYLNSNSYFTRHRPRFTKTPTLQYRRVGSIVPSTPPPEPLEDPDKTNVRKGRPKIVKSLDSKSGDAVSLPADLAESIIWLPEENLVVKDSSLPPEEMIQEALANLLVSFHPKTQHRATYPTSAGPPIEPTVTLYCPIEGGTYVIDATVQELARRTNSDVLILDALDILAGEWGTFGKAAAALQLPSNPLQLGEFQHPQPAQRPEDSDDDVEVGSIGQLMEGVQIGGGRPPFGISIRTRKVNSGSGNSNKKAFFQELVNLQRTEDEPASNIIDPARPRLIYCRDMHLLSDTLPYWYPQFVEAVRSRRQGPISRPQSPALNPTVIVLGVSPSIITPRTSTSSPSDSSGLVNLVMNRNRLHPRNSITPPPTPKVFEWDESSAAQRARDRRLHERLSNWEKYDASVFYPELPNLSAATVDSDSAKSVATRGLMSLFVAIPEGGSGPPTLSPAVPAEDRSRERSNDHPRLTVVLPRLRDPALEVSTRIQQRLQANQINMRTAVGGLGGTLDQTNDLAPEKYLEEVHKFSDPEDVRMRSMFLDWSQRVETWQRVKAIADRSMGSFVADKLKGLDDAKKLGLEPTPVPWSTIAQSWELERASRTHRKDFLSAFTTQPSKRSPNHEYGSQFEEEDEEMDETEPESSEIEDLIEQLKRDPTLDQHEQRLLGSIVNPRHMPTTFAQVHLPAATIDSIRTIVSLPLLKPDAFNYGILKQHGMNGALLFGAPGTGKTLSIRALARESGARMMIIKPSDVMDMYVGEGEKLVRAAFSLARRISPCVVFIDEIDALLGARFSSRGSGGDLAHRRVITEFMQEMDGLKSNKDTNVVVIGATNRPFDLDDAVLRRLPRRLLIDLPGEKERTAILRILLSDEELANEVDIEALAKRTESFSGSDLKHLCVAAALDAVKEGADLPWSVPHHLSENISSPKKTNHSDPSEQNLTVLQTSSDSVSSADPSSGVDSTQADVAGASASNEETSSKRVLRLSHFEKALKEITPSASEQLGSLADLRKWNEEFGEGGRKRGRRIWGSKFGFVDKNNEKREEGRVQQA